MLTAAELSAMRDVEESVLSSTAVIERFTTSGWPPSETWAAVGTIACDLWPISRSNREMVTGGQPIQRGDWYITIPYDTDITAKDRITIAGKTFEVVFVPNDRSWDTALRVEAISYNEAYRTQ